MVRIIAIGIARGDLIDALGDEVSQRVGDRREMAFVAEGVRQALGEANVVINASQKEGPKVRRQGSAIKLSSQGVASNRRKTELLWSRIRHGQAFLSLDRIGFVQILFYQRLEEGLPFFMNNSG